MVELDRVVRRFGSPLQQTAVVHLVTNSIHYHRVEEPGGDSSLQQLSCSDCPGEVMSLEHLCFCSGSEATRVRNRMRDALVKALNQSDEARDWIRNLRHFDLAALLKLLFPPAADSSPAQQHRHAVLCFTEDEDTWGGSMYLYDLRRTNPQRGVVNLGIDAPILQLVAC